MNSVPFGNLRQLLEIYRRQDGKPPIKEIDAEQELLSEYGFVSYSDQHGCHILTQEGKDFIKSLRQEIKKERHVTWRYFLLPYFK